MTEHTPTNPDVIELLEFLKGKTIAGIRIGVPLRIGFDLIFADGSELEIYGQPALAWATMTAEEIAAHEARELAEVAALDAEITAGRAPIFEHTAMWAEIEAEDAEEAREVELFRLAQRAAAEDGFVPLSELLDQHARLHGERIELPDPPAA
jgi:hypothetical protein